MRAGTLSALWGSDLGCTDLVTGSNTLALHEELREILGATIRNSPFPVLDTEGRALLLAFFTTVSRGLLSGRLIFSAFLSGRLLLSE